MAYQINKTDGTIVATVADGQVDIVSTDLTLIGKNYSGYGEHFNENFVKLLENFAGTAEPDRPIRGQIWFDATELKLKVYSGNAFLPVSSATISSTQPTTLGVGDLWFNDVDRQLYFYDGDQTILLGPSYSEAQGTSGLVVDSILDSLNQTRVITYLYNSGVLLGIFSKDSFTPKNAIDGFTGDIIPGFNAGTLSGIKFNVTCTNSEKLGNVDAITYVRKDTSNQIDGQVRISTDLGLVVGSAGQANLTVNNGNVFLSNAATNKQLILNVRRDNTQEDAIVIDGSNRTIDFYEGFTDSEATFGGSVVIQGNLTVNGDTISVNASTLTIEDKNIQLAKQDDVTPTDANASGGGIILEGATKHIMLWSELGDPGDADYPALASNAWTSSEHFNLAVGKEFKIDGVTVLSGNSLGVGITAIPGVTSFGIQNVVNIGPGIPPVAQMRLEDNRISTLGNDDDIELYPDASNVDPTLYGNVKLNTTARITNMADPVDQQDAATKEYVDDIAETRPIYFSMDLSDGKPNSYIRDEILNRLCPPESVTGIGNSQFRDDSVARILCTLLSNSTTNLDINPLINTSTATFNTPSGTAPAVVSVAISTATVPAPPISTTRIIKEFQIVLGVWTHMSDTVLPP